ncbi:MAG: S1 RNA-binding domain-containing protein [Oscillospiraceae bacterium]|jgi:S1 RNA binding domain protein
MELQIGSIVEGKVTGITKFGAFVAFEGGKSGLVHISEIANTYVNDIHEHLSEGQQVKVKIIGLDQNGRINLSLKKAEPEAARVHSGRMPAEAHQPRACAASSSFEDKLKQFLQDSDSRMSDLSRYIDKKCGSRRRRA